MIAAPPCLCRTLPAETAEPLRRAAPAEAPAAEAQRHSVFAEAEREAERYKWIESEKAGRDLGEQALHQWARRHWPAFVRACWMEHLRGGRYWAELDRGDHGILRRLPDDPSALLVQVVRLLEAGGENLDVIRWAQRSGAPMETVLRILEALDVNGRRLPHRLFDP